MNAEDRGQATAGQILVGVRNLCYVLEDRREGQLLCPGGLPSVPCSHKSYLLLVVMTKAIKYIQVRVLLFFKAKGPYTYSAGGFPRASGHLCRAQPNLHQLRHSLSHAAES